ncbi:hypothetical protein EVAR_45467_1 [Eumeta japonica]|uniref:TIL domain-containing protein n=1 Tax=Eumeta variegata TaxID=151549 RepID=A0A4C1WG69_EUMVA|nr:hypothetical protein EVAR_45467_1 [Eumeta japonica]
MRKLIYKHVALTDNAQLYSPKASTTLLPRLRQVATLCRSDERLLACGGCQATCRAPAPACAAVCRVGCYCAPGLLRNDTGHCVPLSECPFTSNSVDLKPLSRYHYEVKLTTGPEDLPPLDLDLRNCDVITMSTQCGESKHCVWESGNSVAFEYRRVPEKSETYALLAFFVSRCPWLRTLRSGRVAIAEYTCFSSLLALGHQEETSEPRAQNEFCPENEEYRFCEVCNRTCANPDPVCPAQCARGCFCKRGLLRDESSGRCVEPRSCQNSLTAPPIPSCPANEEYRICEPCGRTCARPRPLCPAQCARGCFCKRGLLRNSRGLCVAPQLCDTSETTNLVVPQHNSVVVCGERQEYRRCGCERTCLDRLGACDACSAGCFCADGWLRAGDGRCIAEHECPQDKCPNPEEVYECRSTCEEGCNGESECHDRGRGCVLGCYCRAGLLRDFKAGRCVERRLCINTTTQTDSSGPAEPKQFFAYLRMKAAEDRIHSKVDKFQLPHRLRVCRDAKRLVPAFASRRVKARTATAAERPPRTIACECVTAIRIPSKGSIDSESSGVLETLARSVWVPGEASDVYSPINLCARARAADTCDRIKLSRVGLRRAFGRVPSSGRPL